MEEADWPKPNLRSNIGKARAVPKFGTWHEEAGSFNPADVEQQEVPTIRPQKTASSHSGRLQMISSRLLPSSAQSSSEDVSSLLSSRGRPEQRNCQRFTKDFEQARLRRKGATEAAEDAASEKESTAPDEKQTEQMDDQDEQLSDHDLIPKGTARQGSALFQSPSEPPKHQDWNAPAKKETPLAALDSALKNLGVTLREAGRTASTGARGRNPGATPPRHMVAPGTPGRCAVEVDFPEPRRMKGAGDEAPSKDASGVRATPVFGQWAEDPRGARPLSPLSSYSSIFEEARQCRKKLSAKEALERLKAVHATPKEEGISSPDVTCSSDVTSLASGSEGVKWENSADSSPNSASMSEALWLQQRMKEKAAADENSSIAEMYVHSPTETLQQAAKEAKGAMQRANSEIVPPSRLKTVKARDCSSSSSEDSGDKGFLRSCSSSVSKEAERECREGCKDVKTKRMNAERKKGRKSSSARASAPRPPSAQRKDAFQRSRGSLLSFGASTQCTHGTRLGISSSFRAWFSFGRKTEVASPGPMRFPKSASAR